MSLNCGVSSSTIVFQTTAVAYHSPAWLRTKKVDTLGFPVFTSTGALLPTQDAVL